jgi:hypothetical protein
MRRTDFNLLSRIADPTRFCPPAWQNESVHFALDHTELQVTIKGRSLYRLPVAHPDRFPVRLNIEGFRSLDRHNDRISFTLLNPFLTLTQINLCDSDTPG